MKNQGMRYSASNPKLNDRIYTKIDPTKDTIYWYIKFNIPLDPSSVNEKTMFVSDISGYKMQTLIEYSSEYNLISISPIDSYAQDTYYVLNITTKVKSAKGNNLTRKIHILFKLMNDAISEYQVLKHTVTMPPVLSRPSNYNVNKVQNKLQGLDKELLEKIAPDNLPLLPFSISPILGIVGLMIVTVGVLINNINVMIIGLILCVLGVIHIFVQFTNAEKRSIMAYNKGVRLFRKERYNDAKVLFDKAQTFDPHNQIILFACKRTNYYL